MSRGNRRAARGGPRTRRYGWLLPGLLLLLGAPACVSSYDRWHARYPGLGTYRIESEEYEPARARPGGLLEASVVEEISREPLPGALFTVTEMTTHTTQEGVVPASGTLSLPLVEGLYTIRIQTVGFHPLETKPLAVRPGHVLRLRLFMGADY